MNTSSSVGRCLGVCVWCDVAPAEVLLGTIAIWEDSESGIVYIVFSVFYSEKRLNSIPLDLKP